MYVTSERAHGQSRPAMNRRLCGALLVVPVTLGTWAATPADPMASASNLTSPQDPSSFAGPSPLLDETWGDDDSREDEKASAATGSWQPDHDLGSMYNATKWYGAHNAWGTSDSRGQKITGRGIDVAVIDTGVAPVAGLNAPGKVINGPDLSFESQISSTRHLDGYGHGTHMAAIVAGRDSQVSAGNENNDDHFVGVAPDSRIVNVKVAAADGGTDVTQVIAAIDWVVQHRKDMGLDIRVLNLSYGTHSTQPYTVDPLAYAVENAWRKGIVVVAAAGNDGAGAGLTMPAANPYVIAVGAADHLGTDKLEDDATAAFTNTGTMFRRADLLAPGKSVVSLRTPGSYSDRGHPEGLVTGDSAGRFFRGSGTSQATAVVSGAVALLLQQRPTLTPDQVKYLLKTTADRLPRSTSAQGSGALDIKGAFEAATPSTTKARQSWPAATGTGTLEASRGDSHVMDPADGSILRGELDAMGNPWDARSWHAATTAAKAWTGGTWNGRTWTGADWSGTSWTARSWGAATWTGRSWSGGDWQARSWHGDVWTSSGWSTLDLPARSWSQDGWTARSWHEDWWQPSVVW